MLSFLENLRFVNALAPIADAFDSTQYPVAINMATHGRLAFVILKGVGASGTSTITVLAGSDTSPVTEVAIAFEYRRIPSNNLSPGAITAATTAGFTTTAGSGDMYIVEVDAKSLAAAGYNYCSLKMVESVNSPVVGAVLAIAGEPRFSDSSNDIVS